MNITTENYEPCSIRGFIGHGRDLAPLTELGVEYF